MSLIFIFLPSIAWLICFMKLKVRVVLAHQEHFLLQTHVYILLSIQSVCLDKVVTALPWKELFLPKQFLYFRTLSPFCNFLIHFCGDLYFCLSLIILLSFWSILKVNLFLMKDVVKMLMWRNPPQLINVLNNLQESRDMLF